MFSTSSRRMRGQPRGAEQRARHFLFVGRWDIDACGRVVAFDYARDFRFLNMADVISEISDNIA